MKILHLLSSPVFSGPAENVALLALAQRALGHEVWIAVDRKRPGLSAEEPIVPRLSALDLLDEGGLTLCVKSSPLELFRDARRLRRRTEDVFHAHFTHDHLLARWTRPPAGLLIRSIHAPRSLRPSLPRADGYTVPRESDVPCLPSSLVRVLPPLVGPGFRPAASVQALRAQLGIEGRPVIGMISTFQASRRHDVGVAAFAHVQAQRPDARLVLVGDGVLMRTVEDQVARRGLQSAVTFAGYQQGEAFVRWLQALDEVWLLGLGNDWSGRAAAQARACGVRVVAARVGALERFADAVAEGLTPEAVAQASLSGEKKVPPQPTNREIAESILALYARARERRG